MSPHRTAPRSRVLSAVLVRGALVGALVGGTLAALVVATSPAQAGLVAIPVNCSEDKVVLDVDGADYELHGTCGVVVVAASDTHVTMPAAQRLVLRGADNVVEAKPIDTLVIRGHGSQVALPSARVLRLASPGSVVTAEGLIEEVSLGRKRGTVTADQISDLRVTGRGHVVRAGRGYGVTLAGNRTDLDFRRLRSLTVTGDHNSVSVTRGSTEVRNSGSDNRVKVNRRG